MPQTQATARTLPRSHAVARALSSAASSASQFAEPMRLAPKLQPSEQLLQPALDDLLTDIGEHLGALQALQQSQQRLRCSQAQLEMAEMIARIGSWEWDLGSGRVNWSPGLYRILGLEPVAGGTTANMSSMSESILRTMRSCAKRSTAPPTNLKESRSNAAQSAPTVTCGCSRGRPKRSSTRPAGRRG